MWWLITSSSLYSGLGSDRSTVHLSLRSLHKRAKEKPDTTGGDMIWTDVSHQASAKCSFSHTLPKTWTRPPTLNASKQAVRLRQIQRWASKPLAHTITRTHMVSFNYPDNIYLILSLKSIQEHLVTLVHKINKINVHMLYTHSGLRLLVRSLWFIYR